MVVEALNLLTAPGYLLARTLVVLAEGELALVAARLQLPQAFLVLLLLLLQMGRRGADEHMGCMDGTTRKWTRRAIGPDS